MRHVRVRRGPRFAQLFNHTHEGEWISAGAARHRKRVMTRMLRRDAKEAVATEEAEVELLLGQRPGAAPTVTVKVPPLHHGLHHLVRALLTR